MYIVRERLATVRELARNVRWYLTYSTKTIDHTCSFQCPTTERQSAHWACSVVRSALLVIARIHGLTALSRELIHPVLQLSQISPHRNESKVWVLVSCRESASNSRRSNTMRS